MPTDLLTVWEGREVWRSLDTDSYAMALRRIHRVAANVEAEFEKARSLTGRSVDHALFVVREKAQAPAPLPDHVLPVRKSSSRTRTIREAYDRYIGDPKHSWSKRTNVAHMTTRNWVIQMFGAETPLTEITREGCREFVDLLRNMPCHADKRFRDMSIREAVAAAKSQGEERLLNAANVNAYINRFGGLMNWATEEGYIDRNPLRGLKLPDPVRRRDKRKPFSVDQLTRIFAAPLYVGCADDERGYAVPGDLRPRRARFWVPLIALFSGLRLNEICQLEVSDIQWLDGIACFRVQEGISKNGEEKRVKTSASERVVPVHEELVHCGLLKFVHSQRHRGEVHLFPELPLGHLGYRSTAVSRWFARFLASANATAPLTCFHSFRHNFRDGLRDAKVDREVALNLGGWAGEGKGSAVADIYGSGHRTAILSEAINRVRYPGLDLAHLAIG